MGEGSATGGTRETAAGKATGAGERGTKIILVGTQISIEWYAVLRDVKNGDLSETEAIKRLECSPSWGWTAMDPASKLLLVIDVGARTLGMAQRVVHHVVGV
jgi:hypothetical protein